MNSGHNEGSVKHNRVTKKHLGYGRESAGMIGLRRKAAQSMNDRSAAADHEKGDSDYVQQQDLSRSRRPRSPG